MPRALLMRVQQSLSHRAGEQTQSNSGAAPEKTKKEAMEDVPQEFAEETSISRLLAAKKRAQQNRDEDRS